MNSSPVISIFLPVFNGGEFLLETLQSLASQTFANFEVLVGDDGSTDGSIRIARSFAESDARFKVFCFEHRGEVSTRNDLLTRVSAHAKYLMNHDCDDISLPTKLERLAEVLEDHPEIAGVGCYAEYFGDVADRAVLPEIEWRPEQLRKKFADCNHLINSAVLVRREVFERTGKYREDFRSTDDYDFWARALKLGFDFMNLPQILHRIRLHKTSVCGQRSAAQAELGAQVQSDLRAHFETSEGQLQSRRSYLKVSDRLNILHTVEFYAPQTGGAELVVQQLSERLAARGHHVTVATSKLAARRERELNGVNICQFDVSGSLAYGLKGSEQNRYASFVKSFRADVLMSYAAQQWSTDLALAASIETRQKRVNIVAPCGYSALSDAHTLRWPHFQEYFTTFLPSYLPFCDASIYHSAAYQDYEFGERLGLNNMMVIPNGVGLDEFSNKPDFSFRQKYDIWSAKILLCVGNFIAGKGHDRLLQMFRRLNREDCALVLIGRDGGTLEDLRELAQGLNVFFLSDIPRADTLAAYWAADIFVFASEIECFPLVLLEAMAAGLPFVSTDCGSVRQLRGGLVCRPEGLVDNVKSLLADEALRRQLAQEGSAEWRAKYTWDSVVDQYEALYQRLYWEKFPAHKAQISVSTEPPKIVATSLEPAAALEPDTPLVSIALATKNRLALLEQFVECLPEACGDCSYELLLLDGNSSDGSAEFAGKISRAQIFDERRELGAGRHPWPQLYNYLFSRARGKFVMYASDDVTLTPGAISKAVELIEAYRSQKVAGGIFFYKNVVAETFWDRLGIDFTMGGYLLMNYGLLDREVVTKLGGFSEDYAFYCADGDLCYKLYQAGYDLMPIPGSGAVHNNVMDLNKQINNERAAKDIKLYQTRWGKFSGTTDLPEQRRLQFVQALEQHYLTPYRKGFEQKERVLFWRELARQIRGANL